MKNTVSIIVAVGKNGEIGRKGDLAFHIGGDLRHFKEITMGKPVIMGRKTFESLPKGALPGRRNIVITRNGNWTAPGAERAASLDEALDMTERAPERMIIGGGEIYRQAMSVADRIYLTRIDADLPDADTFFPKINPVAWTVADETELLEDPKSGLKYRFICLSRTK
ncbi:MAG: dihydrofolate reductase [Paramuribaculum sp.]|nr:dihydrofolate reductase [Paramuribaculum sp.]